jgi:RNA polymerase sigma-70 factor (ECF subfamily)
MRTHSVPRFSLQTIASVPVSHPAATRGDQIAMPVAVITSSSSGQPENGQSDVARAAAGDRRAFERLYREHVDRVFSLCARMCGDRAQAEELTQDVFVRAWEKLTLFRGESAFGTWLHRLAVNVVLNARKGEGRRRAKLDATPDALDTIPRRADRVGDRMDLEAAISLLPPGARRVFVLHDVQGYRHEDIAEQLGMTTGGSKAQLHRARMLLREALGR